MKTAELFEAADRYNYADWLISEWGIKRLASGTQGDIFQHPHYENIVVKVFDTDKAYAKYLAWCLDNQSNRYVPPIQSTAKKSGLNFVFFKKLTPAKHTVVMKMLKDIVKAAGEIVDVQPNEISSLQDLWDGEWARLAKWSKDKDFAAFAGFMAKATRSSSFYNDLHDKNVMMDGDQVVFIDPLGQN